MILSSWSKMRKYLEQEMLADSLKERIRFNCTSYVNMDGVKIFEIFVDGKLEKQFSWETVNTYFRKDEKFPNGKGKITRDTLYGYWTGFHDTLFNTPITERDEYTDRDFCEALAEYRQQPISDSQVSENPIVRMFAVLDRRTGKRSLEKMKQTINIQPEWLQKFYLLRMNAENI